MTKKLVLREKIYVPIHKHYDLEELDNTFVIDIFDEKGCEPCDFRDDRPVYECRECPNYSSRTKLYKEKYVGGQRYVGLPYGLKREIPEYFPDVVDYDVVDRRSLLPMKSSLAFKGTLRPHQVEVKETLLKYAQRTGAIRGLLKSVPRTGKTVMAVDLACTLRTRTLILANQYDFLRQFYDTFMGNDKLDIPTPALTNGPELESKGRKVVHFAKTVDDYFVGDVVLSTYQKFISDIGKEKLAKVISQFGLVVVDEVHRCSAIEFLKVVGSFNTTHLLGLTATPKRKDCRHVLADAVVGNVIAETQVESLRPKVVFHETGCAPKAEYSNWVYFYKWQNRQDKRYEVIVDQAVADIKAGRSIAIPCVHKETVFYLIKLINLRFPRPVAAEYIGGNTDRRDAVRMKAMNGRIKAVVGIRSLMSTGINVPIWSVLYVICPITNGPQFEQEFFRVLTPLEGKPQPLVRFFLDDATQWRATLRICLFHKENGLLHHKAIIDQEAWAVANKYVRGESKGGKRPVEINKDAKGRRML